MFTNFGLRSTYTALSWGLIVWNIASFGTAELTFLDGDWVWYEPSVVRDRWFWIRSHQPLAVISAMPCPYIDQWISPGWLPRRHSFQVTVTHPTDRDSVVWSLGTATSGDVGIWDWLWSWGGERAWECQHEAGEGSFGPCLRPKLKTWQMTWLRIIQNDQ